MNKNTSLWIKFPACTNSTDGTHDLIPDDYERTGWWAVCKDCGQRFALIHEQQLEAIGISGIIPAKREFDS